MKCWAGCNSCGHLWLTDIGDDLGCPKCGEEMETEHRFDIKADCLVCGCGTPIDPNDEDCVEMADSWICGNCIRYWDACDTQEAAALDSSSDNDCTC